MPKVALQIRAVLENVTNICPADDEFRWYMKLECGSCGEVTQAHQYFTALDSHPLKGGRGEASLVIKCKLCSRENSIAIIQGSVKPYDIETSPKFKTIVEFDCRGVSPQDFEARGGWKAESSESSAKFDDIDLSEEWTDYDDKANVSVSVMELEHQFIKSK